MNNINSDIEKRVRELPGKQQKFFHQLIQDGEHNPQEAAARLRQDLFDGKVNADFLITSQLACAALNDPKTESHFPTEAQAQATYTAEIERLRETDEGSEVADQLQGMLDRTNAKVDADKAKLKAFEGTAEALKATEDKRKLDAYEAAYNAEKTARISELTVQGGMTVARAEAQFEQIEHSRIASSLRRFHGIA
jgi:hypothetical protein